MTESLREIESSRPPRARGAVSGLGRWIAKAVRIVCGIFALILATHIVFTLFEANPDKGITRVIADWASGLTLGLKQLFTPTDIKIAMLVNYGIAAILWLVIGAIIARILSATLSRRAL